MAWCCGMSSWCDLPVGGHDVVCRCLLFFKDVWASRLLPLPLSSVVETLLLIGALVSSQMLRFLFVFGPFWRTVATISKWRFVLGVSCLIFLKISSLVVEDVCSVRLCLMSTQTLKRALAHYSSCSSYFSKLYCGDFVWSAMRYLLFTVPCFLVFETVLWHTGPFGRRSSRIHRHFERVM